MRLFRGKLCANLKAQDDIRRPHSMSPTHYRNLINQLGRKDWHVEIMEPYEHGEGVINYLARYVKGGPINNSQLSEAQDKIILKYQSHQTQRQERHSFSRNGFITQLLIHVPDKGKRTLRFYGLYTSGKRKALNQARALHKRKRSSRGQTPPTCRDRILTDWPRISLSKFAESALGCFEPDGG